MHRAMHRALTRLAPVAAAAAVCALTACGGGGSGGAEPPVTTNTLEDSSAVANALATEAHAAMASASRVPDTTAAAQVSALANAVAAGQITVSAGRLTVPCALGGSISADFPSNLGNIVVGTPYTLNFINCVQVAGQTANGVLSLSFVSLSNTNNFSETATFNVTVTQANGSSTTYSGKQSCTVVAGVADCSYSDGARSFAGNFSQKGGTLNGSYAWAYPLSNGSAANVTFQFSNWTASAGSIEVDGPNKFRATVTRDGANSYTITIKGGAPRKVTVPG
jgi:hypothetical protein